ncbi:MAG: DUF5397 family protein [Solirubrobacteraceae bacterium]
MSPLHMTPPSTADLGGRFHRFGADGPAYEVLKPESAASAGDWLMRVRILTTGEEVDYLASRIKADPPEAGAG